jgi:hypothetical protein
MPSWGDDGNITRCLHVVLSKHILLLHNLYLVKPASFCHKSHSHPQLCLAL